MQFDLFQTDFKLIKVVTSPSAGICLFTSLARKLFGHGMNSKEMKEASYQLRADVVSYINKNEALFEHEIKGRVLDNFEERKELQEWQSASIDLKKE